MRAASPICSGENSSSGVIANCSMCCSIALHRGGAIVALLLRPRDDLAQFVGLLCRDREACLLLLKFGETLEFEIGRKFGYEIRETRPPPGERAKY